MLLIFLSLLITLNISKMVQFTLPLSIHLFLECWIQHVYKMHPFLSRMLGFTEASHQELVNALFICRPKDDTSPSF